MRVYVDQERKPEDYLSEEDRNGLLVFKDPIAALCFLHENEKDIEVAYLGHYPTDYYFQGSDIVEDIFLHKYYDEGIEEGIKLIRSTFMNEISKLPTILDDVYIMMGSA